MKSTAKYYDGKTAQPHLVELFLVISANTLEVRQEGEVILNLNLDVVNVLSFSEKHLILEVNEVSNASIEIEDQAFIDYFETLNSNNGGFTLQRKILQVTSQKFLRFFFLLIGFLLLFYFVLLPKVLSSAVDAMSMDVDRQIGDLVYENLQEQESFNFEKGALLTEFYHSIDSNHPSYVQLHLDNAPTVNAFALPGGHIVVYRGLLEKMKSPEELAALISHELSHVEQRHTMKMLAENSTNAVMGYLILGNVGGINVGQSLLVSMKQMSFSRELEEEADLEGLHYLKKWKINPIGFTNLFNILKEETGSGESQSFFDSHPALNERIAQIKRYSKGQSFMPLSEKSKAIFKKLTEE